jgi:hypothetical protein
LPAGAGALCSTVIGIHWSCSVGHSIKGEKVGLGLRVVMEASLVVVMTLRRDILVAFTGLSVIFAMYGEFCCVKVAAEFPAAARRFQLECCTAGETLHQNQETALLAPRRVTVRSFRQASHAP